MLTYSGRRVRPSNPSRRLANTGTRQEFLRAVRSEIGQAVQRGRSGLTEIAPWLFDWIGDTRNLRCAYDHLAEGGPAAGPDNVTYDDLNNRDVWALARMLSKQLHQGHYRHGPVRDVPVPKSSGRGSRTISLANIQDRVVSRAIAQIIGPLLDPKFDRHSFNRIGVGRFDALATAAAFVRFQRRNVWIVDDVSDAFGNVPLERLQQVVRKRIPCPKVVKLVAESMGISRGKGLLQGPPLSPLLMNLYLDHFMDKPWRRLRPDIPLLRFMDDLLVLCQPDDDAQTIYADLVRTAKNAGLHLKFDAATAIRTLGRDDVVDWLGFRIFGNDAGIQPRLKLDDGPRGLRASLRDSLLEQHGFAESPQGAVRVIEGMIAEMGPAYLHSDHRQVYSIFSETARDLAFEEIPTISQFNALWSAAYTRWARCREKAIRDFDDETEGNRVNVFGRFHKGG